jgi:hypothetical protein
MSSIAARVLALALAALLDLAALAASIVCAAIGLPRFLAAVCMMAPRTIQSVTNPRPNFGVP